MKSKKLIIKKSCYYSFMIITGLSTVASILGYSMKDILNNLTWWKCIIILLLLFILLSIIIMLIYLYKNHKGINIFINGKKVIMRQGDIFDTNGIKIIPFNERFDTKVDDIIISHNSLNGIMIDRHVDNIDNLTNIIKNAKDEKTDLLPTQKKGKLLYPLGRIIRYKDYLMLAMTHFDSKNQSYINMYEYEAMLTNMWKEIRRVYAGKEIVLPLIGSGITTFTDSDRKNNTTLLKCMLCTLKRSGFSPTNGITIVLTQEVIDTIDMVKIKEEFKYDI